MRCIWCRNPDSDQEPEYPEKELCNSHLAEYEGLSEDELNRMYQEERMDLI
jgi:pyruvate-formate lyase-activating enzyme